MIFNRPVKAIQPQPGSTTAGDVPDSVQLLYTAADGCGPLVSVCHGDPCTAEDEGKFCPPDAPGGQKSDTGYCCVDGEWKAGTCCDEEIEKKEPKTFVEEVCTWVSYADAFKSAFKCVQSGGAEVRDCAEALEELTEVGVCLSTGNTSKACHVIELLADARSDASLAKDFEEFGELFEDGEGSAVEITIDAAQLACQSKQFIKDLTELFGGCTADCSKIGKVCAEGYCRVCSEHDFDTGAACAFRDDDGTLKDGFCREKTKSGGKALNCQELKPLNWGCEDDSECDSGFCRELNPKPDKAYDKFRTECGTSGASCSGGWCREKDADDNTVWDCHSGKPTGYGAGDESNPLPVSVCYSGEKFKSENCPFDYSKMEDVCKYYCGPTVSTCHGSTCTESEEHHFCMPGSPGGGDSNGYCCKNGTWEPGACEW